MAYATAAELRADMNLDSTDDDASLERILDAATAKIDKLCNRQDGFVADTAASARYYSATGKPYIRIHECVSVSAVAVKGSPSDDEDSYTAWTVGTIGTTTSADVFPATGDPKRPAYNTTPYTLLIIGANADHSRFTTGEFVGRGGFRPSTTVTRGVVTVEVTARWGYATTVPADIKTACIMQAARWYKRQQSAMADTTATPEMGTLLYQKALDPDIKGILVDGGWAVPRIGRPL